MAKRAVPRRPPTRKVNHRRRPPRRSVLRRPGGRRRHSHRGPVRRFLFRFWYLWLPLLLAFFVGAGALVYLYVTIPLPPERVLQETTFLFDRNGKRLTGLDAEVDRTIIPLKKMPRHLREAVLAAEDTRFYSHPGVSPVDIARAAWADATGGRIRQGASTVTQQLVRAVFPEVGTERTLTRKAKEAILAVKLERELDKDQILERYLNTVYFGSGAYGVQAAARTYFGKPAKALDLVESAALAAIIARPQYFSPHRNPNATQERRDFVLDRMAEVGFITRQQAAEAKKRPLKPQTFEQGFAGTPSAWFVDHTIDFLEREFGAEKTFSGGLRVRTTVDQKWQRAANQAIRNHEAARSGADAALVAIDPSNGAIRAIGSNLRYSADPEERTFHPATFGCSVRGCGKKGGAGGTGRQIGSAAKVLTVAAVVEEGISLNSTFSGRTPVVLDDPPCGSPEEPWDPENFEGSSFGAMDLYGATASSVNTIFAQLIEIVGPSSFVDVAHRLGIKSRVPPLCSITLGAMEANVLEMTSAYATLANGGVRRNPTPVRAVRDTNGNVLFKNEGKGKRVMKANDAWQVVKALKGVMFGTGTAAYFGVDSFGKTGSEDDRSDAWFCGGTTELVACVWVGRHEAQIPVPGITGGSAAAPIWHDFMVAAHEDLEPGTFPEPELTGEIAQGSVPLPPPPAPEPEPEEEEPEEKPKQQEEKKEEKPKEEENEEPAPSPSPEPSTPPEEEPAPGEEQT